MNVDPLLTTTEAAAFLGLAVATLESWRCRPPPSGEAPPFCKLGRAIRYRRSSLEAWLAAREFRSTSAVDVARRKA